MIFKRKNKKKQGLSIYCPRCNSELISSGRFIEDKDGIVKYQCNKCGTTSFWNFDYPAPYLRTCGECIHLIDNEFGSPYCKKEANKECSPDTQIKFDVHGCEYCDGEKTLLFNSRKDKKLFIKYPNRLTYGEYFYNKLELDAARYIKYCPMCGKKLKRD